MCRTDSARNPETTRSFLACNIGTAGFGLRSSPPFQPSPAVRSSSGSLAFGRSTNSSSARSMNRAATSGRFLPQIPLFAIASSSLTESADRVIVKLWLATAFPFLPLPIITPFFHCNYNVLPVEDHVNKWRSLIFLRGRRNLGGRCYGEKSCLDQFFADPLLKPKNCQESSLQTKVMFLDSTRLPRQNMPETLAGFVVGLGILIIGGKIIFPTPPGPEKARPASLFPCGKEKAHVAHRRPCELASPLASRRPALHPPHPAGAFQ